MAVYTFKKFNNPKTERIESNDAVVGGFGSTNNPDYNQALGLGRKDVGSIIQYAGADNEVSIVNKSSVDLSSQGFRYYLLMEVPTDDTGLVVTLISTAAELDNLIEDVPRGHSYAKQYYDLRNTGVK